MWNLAAGKFLPFRALPSDLRAPCGRLLTRLTGGFTFALHGSDVLVAVWDVREHDTIRLKSLCDTL